MSTIIFLKCNIFRWARLRSFSLLNNLLRLRVAGRRVGGFHQLDRHIAQSDPVFGQLLHDHPPQIASQLSPVCFAYVGPIGKRKDQPFVGKLGKGHGGLRLLQDQPMLVSDLEQVVGHLADGRSINDPNCDSRLQVLARIG